MQLLVVDDEEPVVEVVGAGDGEALVLAVELRDFALFGKSINRDMGEPQGFKVATNRDHLLFFVPKRAATCS